MSEADPIETIKKSRLKASTKPDLYHIFPKKDAAPRRSKQELQQLRDDKGVLAQVSLHRQLAASRNPSHRRGRVFSLPSSTLMSSDHGHNRRPTGSDSSLMTTTTTTKAAAAAAKKTNSWGKAARRSDGSFDPGHAFSLLSFRRLALYEHCADNLDDPHAAAKLGGWVVNSKGRRPFWHSPKNTL